jgi:peroxiredoxin
MTLSLTLAITLFITTLGAMAQTAAAAETTRSAATADTVPLLPDCSSDPVQTAESGATIHISDPVHVRYSLGGNADTCYAVSATVNGKTVEGFLLGTAHPDVASFEREARSHVPQIPPPPPPPPPPPAAVAPNAKAGETAEKAPEPEGPKSFAGLSGVGPNGRRVSLAGIASPIVVLYFWSATSRSSIREADGMEGIYNQYRSKGVTLVGVISGGAVAARRVVRDEEVLWPQILDNGDIAARYSVNKEAKYFVLNRRGDVLAELKTPGEVQRALKQMR